MQTEHLDVNLLLGEGQPFEEGWSKLMFNLEAAKELRAQPADQIALLLLAGARFTGRGWSTGKASRALYQLSGIPLVRGSFPPYRDIWLMALALIWGVDVPQLDLEPEAAAAAFAIASQAEQHDTEEPQQEEEGEEEETKFSWDQPEVTTPKELTELWSRAQRNEHRIDVRPLFEVLAPLAGIPARAPENQLIPAHRKKQDQFLRSVSQNVLQVVRLLGHNWVPQTTEVIPRGQVNLQIFQLLGEVYYKIQSERKELAVPGITRTSTSHTDSLFTEDDVRQHRMDNNINRIRGGQANRPWRGKGGLYGSSSSSPRFGYGKGRGVPFRSMPWRAPWRGGRGKGQ
eukprot:EG_transcript_12027